MGYHERGMQPNIDKYAFEDGDNSNKPVVYKREEEMNLRNQTAGGYRIPVKSVKK
jgi:hypothetical protein